VKRDLHVAGGGKPLSRKHPPELQIVVDLPVAGDGHPVFGRGDWLHAGCKVEDGQPVEPDPDMVLHKHGALIGSTVPLNVVHE
jgi:hypothetical protein